MGEISWVSKVKGESHLRLEVSVAVSIVRSRQVPEAKKEKGPRQSTLEVIPLRPTNRPALLKVFLSRIPDGLVPAAGFAPETAIIRCVHSRPIIRFVLDALLMTGGS